MSWEFGPWADEAADGDLKPHAPAERGQVVESAGVAAAHAGCVVAAKGTSRRGSGGCQRDGEVLDLERGADEATPIGSARQLERKQREAPETWFEMG